MTTEQLEFKFMRDDLCEKKYKNINFRFKKDCVGVLQDYNDFYFVSVNGTFNGYSAQIAIFFLEEKDANECAKDIKR